MMAVTVQAVDHSKTSSRLPVPESYHYHRVPATKLESGECESDTLLSSSLSSFTNSSSAPSLATAASVVAQLLALTLTLSAVALLLGVGWVALTQYTSHPSSAASNAAPLNLPASPSSILASDGLTYPLSAYPASFLFPDKYAAGAEINETALLRADPATLMSAPPWRPYPPHRHPPVPRVDFILRTFAGYSPLTSYMLRSLELLMPYRQLGDVIVVLDDTMDDRQYAATLPDDVKVFYEPKPAFFDDWGQANMQSGTLGVSRAVNGYAVGLYSNWVSGPLLRRRLHLCTRPGHAVYHARLVAAPVRLGRAAADI